jgi:hypothetical protein
MKLPRRSFLHLAAGAVALPGVSRIARAQPYPSRPVRIIVGFAAGGTTDIISRLIGQWLSERRRTFAIAFCPCSRKSRKSAQMTSSLSLLGEKLAEWEIKASRSAGRFHFVADA